MRLVHIGRTENPLLFAEFFRFCLELDWINEQTAKLAFAFGVLIPVRNDAYSHECGGRWWTRLYCFVLFERKITSTFLSWVSKTQPNHWT